MRILHRNIRILAAGLLLGFSLVALVRLAFRHEPEFHAEALPVLGPIGGFALRDHEGRVFGRDNLLGTVHVVNFLFTSCEATCPLLVRQMQDVERNTRDLGNAVRFLSVTVDPETDTPEVLRTYAARRGVDFARWSFLTGGLEAVERAVVGAFQSPMSKRNVAPEGSATTLFEITHGEHFVLVDRKARIRAFHQARSVADVEAMVAAIRSLVQETSAERELAHDR